VTETQGRIEELSVFALQMIARNDLPPARDALVAVAHLLPDSSPVRAPLFQALTTLSFHLSGGSTPPPQLIARVAQLAGQLTRLAQPVKAIESRHSSAKTAKKFGSIGVALAFLMKIKTVGLLFLTKGKILLLGLTNFKAILSIAGFVGIYWALYGWWFAIGFAASIFVHEMGHYVTVRRYGFQANAPMFIPGLGAYVSWRGGLNVDPEVRARISLAGPLFGFIAAIASYMVYAATGSGIWLAIAHVGAFINLFNLIPIFIFDGGSAFAALGRQERMAVLIVSLALWFFLSEFMFLFIALGAGYRVLLKKDFPQQSSHSTAYYFIGLLVALGLFDWWILIQAHALRAGF